MCSFLVCHTYQGTGLRIRWRKYHHGNQKVEGISRSWEGRSPCSMHTAWVCKISQRSLLQQTQTLDWLGYIGVSRGHSVPTPMVPGPRHLAQVEHGCTDLCSHLRGLEGLASGEGAAPGASARLRAWPLSVSKHGLCPPRCGDDASRVPLSPQPVAPEAGEILSGGHRGLQGPSLIPPEPRAARWMLG